MVITTHFDMSEFACKCGCGICNYERSLFDKLEKLRTMLGDKPINIISGYRCPKHSVDVGGSATDAHTKGIAADINVKGLTSWDIAEKAEQCGFTGIGIISDTNCHVDIRNSSNYVNSHWFGNEMTGENFIKTFQRESYKNTSIINIDGVNYRITIEKE